MVASDPQPGVKNRVNRRWLRVTDRKTGVILAG